MKKRMTVKKMKKGEEGEEEKKEKEEVQWREGARQERLSGKVIFLPLLLVYGYVRYARKGGKGGKKRDEKRKRGNAQREPCEVE
eukprot:evm.model.NODE_9584_length_17488_cov_50.871456.6